MTTFNPEIICFACNWCTYAGADLAGTSKIQYPANLKIIRVMCTGRINPESILEAFTNGVDGILISGCHPPNDCHYVNGNLKAKNRVILLKSLMEQLGIEPNRLRLEWISASEGDEFSKKVIEFVEEIKELGPNPIRRTVEPQVNLG
jgi:F420-non-reducing hydrogenase iron-sulfur subunit